MRKFLAPLAVKLGLYKQVVKLDTYFQNKKAARCFHRYGLETLQKADEALSSVGGHMILYFGSLLGAIREKGFIPYDYDLDVALPIEDKPDDIDALMGKYGFVHTRQHYIKATGRVTYDQYCYHGCHLDIFYLFSDREDGKVYSYVARRHETREWREANDTDGFPCVVWPTDRCEYVRRDFLGLQLYLPEKADQWMKDIYGESYMTPLKVWDAKNQPTVIEYPKDRIYRR